MATIRKELTLREIQLSSLDILKYIDKACRDNKLKYYLAYGTLIGAIRHNGFIPWDDDIDIMMPRKDYDTLINILQTKEIEPYKLFTPKDKEYPYGISRLSDSRYVLDVDNEKPYGIGTFVDIYPIDCFGNSYDDMVRIKRKASKYSSLLFLSTRSHFKIAHTKGIKKFIKFPAFILAKIIGKNYFKKKLEKIKHKHTDDQGKYIGCLVWGSDGEKGIFEKELFNTAIRVKFENGTFLIPKEYNKILSQLYGDYMKMPPKSKQTPHHDYRAYKTEER